MPGVTGAEIIGDAFAELNVFLPGESVPANDSEFARRKLNDFLSEWGQRNAYIPLIGRHQFAMTAGKGSPTNPYTIGVGGDLNMARPSNQGSITAANLVLTTSSPNVRINLGIYTNEAYNSGNLIPAMSNSQPTGLYYNPTYANDLGSVFLWPVPDIAYNQLELFTQDSIALFADTTTTYYVPDGVPEALKYTLADRLQGPYGRTLSAAQLRIMVTSVGAMKRANLQLVDVPNDAYMFSQGRGTLYNLVSGSGG